MYCLINDHELAETLSNFLLKKHLKKIDIPWKKTNKIKSLYAQGTVSREELESKIAAAVKFDLERWRDQVIIKHKKMHRPLIKHLAKSLDQLLKDKRNKKKIIKIYLADQNPNFIKSFGPQITDKPIWATNRDRVDYKNPILIRNLTDSKKFVKVLLENQLPFWFIDSGYTNFLYQKKKPWHRIVAGNIHSTNKKKYFPSDRLSCLPSFPRHWKSGGEKILVVEPSDQYCLLFNTTLNDWKNHIRSQIRKYSDRPIEFREKNTDRKSRSSVFDFLKDRDDYYCVISQASAAAVEAIWLGIPVITTSCHITNSVSRQDIKDINNLYRGPIGDWLCELTYSQFSFEEICNGKARSILLEFHDV